MSEHTPGPWVIRMIGIDRDLPVVTSNTGDICAMRYNTNNASRLEANARLIASSPKLLTALKECLEQLSHEGLDRVPAAIHAREAIREAAPDEASS